MSVSVEESSPLSEGQSTILDKSSSESVSLNPNDTKPSPSSLEDKSEDNAPNLHPMAFTVDFGESKPVDNRRLEELAKKSQARHQRVQSMSASLTRPSPIAQKPPLSGKLPRKAQGYNSEGYFSSDQEDSGLSGSVKVRNSPLAHSSQITSPSTNRHIKPLRDFQPKRTSKSPIVDSIMSRSDNFSNRQGLNLPLKSSNNSFLKDIHRTPSYGSLYQPRPMEHIIDRSPSEAVMLTDISSPELDILTPDNGLSTPEQKSPLNRKIRAQSETLDLLLKKCPNKIEPLYIDDEVDRESNNSSTGTYTIEGDNYTEEQKARMSIDRTFGTDTLDGAIKNTLKRNTERDPELIFDFPKVVTREPRRDVNLRSPLSQNKTFDIPEVSKDKNVLEISCCYESPTEHDLAAQTSKQIKSTRSYLEKIKNRVRNITEKTFSKSPPKYHSGDADVGSFTSVTTSGVLSSKNPSKNEYVHRRRCSLTKSEIDQTDYIHQLSRESSVPLNLPSKYDTTVKHTQKSIRDDTVESPDQVVNKLSYLSLNRCKGDKTWIQDWAESVKKYNNDTLSSKGSDCTFTVDSDRPPHSPRHLTKPRSPHGNTPTKIPSPVGTLLHRRTPDLIPPQETEAYLLKTQNAISNLQAKLHSRPNPLTSSTTIDKSSKLPVSQLSRSNSLNYRLRRKETSDISPLRSPGNYVITGSSKNPESNRLLTTASKSLDQECKRDSNMNSPVSDVLSDDKTLSNKYDVDAILSPHRKKVHTDLNNANQTVSLKTVLKHNAFESNYPRIDQTRCLDTKKHNRVSSDSLKHLKYNTLGTSIKRSSSFNTVNKNNNYLDPKIKNQRQIDNFLSDESDNEYDRDRHKKQMNRGRIDSKDLKSVAPANSPRCPNTPEMQRKFGPGLARNSVRVTNKERVGNTRMSEPPMGHQSRRVSEPTRQAVMNRLTKSRSSTREFQPKKQEKGQKRPSQHRSSSALATKEIEFSNWKKRSSYDPMKAAQEGRRRQQMAKRQEFNKDDLSSPSHSSPVHRSQSFHTTNIAELSLEYSSEEDIPNDMLTSTHSEMLPDLSQDYSQMFTSTHSEMSGLRAAMRNDVVIAPDYVTRFQVNPPVNKLNRRDIEKRKTYLVDDITPTKENIDFLSKRDEVKDKRKTFILDSDTNSTTNGSSPRNSSIFSHEKQSVTDTDCESGAESAPVRHTKRSAQPGKRHSGDLSSSVQARYLDISKYKSAPQTRDTRTPSDKQKKQELEKWKRRASYDPRKAAALGKTAKVAPKTANSVLRSQSFHGPELVSTTLRYQPQPTRIAETYDASSDNDF